MKKFLFEPASKYDPPRQLASLRDPGHAQMLTQTSSRVKMGFNYLLMERKFNFPSQLASDFCTMQEICGLR